MDVVPKIDEMVRQRVTPAEFDRYMKDPERPAFLQVLRAHEIGGRPIPDLLDAITAEPLDGARSIAAVLHGRAGKGPAPARGTTTGWDERAPRDASPEIEAAGHMLDARQAALGERLAANPPAWAVEAWGVPPAEPGALRDDWQRRAGHRRVLPRGGRDHRPATGDRTSASREGASRGGVPRLCPGIGAA